MEFMKQETPAEVLKTIKEKADEVYEMREKLSALEKEFKLKKAELLDIMVDAGVDKLQGDLCSVSAKPKTSVSCPKGEKEKSDFFQYIATTYGKEVLNDMLTVNAKTLSAWHDRELEKKTREGDLDFKVPGLEPYNYNSLGITKRRTKKGE